MKKLPVGIQNFREIIEGGYTYIDKTSYVYDLINDSKHYFLSRPRRFGKSLLLDTINEAFSGDNKLFEGLFINNTDYPFKKHPVLRLDMSSIANESPEILKDELAREMRNKIYAEGITCMPGHPSSLFKDLIKVLYDKYKNSVVVLIDEYDKPIIDRLGTPDIAEANRDVLRGFYGIIKSMDRYIKLSIITGVSKFTKTSVFSGLNNLRDITLTRKYAGICGIATQDLDKYFGEYIEKLSAQGGFKDYKNLHDEILAWYDGYSWDGVNRVINPFSLLSFFNEERFSCFWFDSGTPKFLIDIIKKRPEGYTDLSDTEIGEWALNSFDIQDLSAAPLLFQTGYLTIKEILYNQTPAVYVLSAPNFEVKTAFNLYILASFTEKESGATESAYRKIKESLITGNLNEMLAIMKALFASIPYEIHIGREAYYHSIFIAIMNVLGFNADAEVSVSGGRVDAVLELDDKIYIIEFKYKECEQNTDADEKRKIFESMLEKGISQIKDKGYGKKYIGTGKTLYLAAFAFLGRADIEMRVETV